MIHELKTEPQYFHDMSLGLKAFEIRINDRLYAVGDYLALNEFDKSAETYTGRSMMFRVKYILNDVRFCKDGYIIMGLNPIEMRPQCPIDFKYGEKRNGVNIYDRQNFRDWESGVEGE